MPRATTQEISRHRSTASADHLHDVVEEAGRVLDEYRVKMVALTVQLDRCGPDGRDDLRLRVDVTRNAYLATRTQLTDIRRSSRSSLGTLQRELETVMADLRLAGESAEALVRSGRQ